ncbi:MAG: MBL fold metallo-hydrolase [Bacteroidales bacterium]|nr:MBL fold metallo-hydrolase [Bacteroidales bacterium]
MTLTILSDNHSVDERRLPTEHGLSILLRTEKQQILLDTGASDLFLRNARTLGIDLREVDYVFLSHGHRDHAGGLAAFLAVNDRAQVIVSPEAVSGRFFSRRGGLHDISTDWPLEAMAGRTIYVRESLTLPGGIRILAGIGNSFPQPKGNRHLLAEQADGAYGTDSFRHELALYADGLLFSGCAHHGLENILAACPGPVRTLVGGFHLLDAREGEAFERADELRALAGRLGAAWPQTTFYTGHCTGALAFETLQAALGERLQAFRCGMEIQL